MRLNRCAKAGVLERLTAELQREALAGVDEDTLALDSTIVKFHAHWTRAQEKGHQAIGGSRSLPQA